MITWESPYTWTRGIPIIWEVRKSAHRLSSSALVLVPCPTPNENSKKWVSLRKMQKPTPAFIFLDAPSKKPQGKNLSGGFHSPKLGSLDSQKNLLDDAINISFFTFKYRQITSLPYNPHHIEEYQEKRRATRNLFVPIFDNNSYRCSRKTNRKIVMLPDIFSCWFPYQAIREKVLHRFLIITAKWTDTGTW